MSNNSDWQSMALKAAAGIAAIAVVGYTAWFLSKEDEAETVGPLLKEKIGKLQIVQQSGASVIELKQLLKILDFIKEMSQTKTNELMAARNLTVETFRERRFQLFSDKNWTEYEELLQWETSCQDKAFGESMDVVARALAIEKGVIVISATMHGQNMASLSAMTDSLAAQEKNRKPKLTRVETIKHLCYLNGERTKMMIDSIESGETKKIKASKDPHTAKQNFYKLVEAKAYDRLFAEHKVNEQDLSFASRYYKADQEPAYQNQVQEDFIKLQTFAMSHSQASEQSTQATAHE